MGSDSESEFEADPEELQSEESSADASEYDGSDASDDSGSGSGYDDDSDDGDDWEELERKAAKCTYINHRPSFLILICKPADSKRAAEAKGTHGDSESDDDRPKKKKVAAKPKTNGKSKKR